MPKLIIYVMNSEILWYTLPCWRTFFFLNQSFDLEYSKYLQEVVQALESDPDFRKKLESTNEEDIKVSRSNMNIKNINFKV